MAYNQHQYADPYAKEQQQAQYDDEPPYHLPQNPRYDSTPNPYDAEKRQTRFEDPEEEYGTRESRYGANLDPRPQSQWTIPPPPKSTGFLRIWRKDERGKQWGKGGGFRTCFRMFSCCFCTGIFIFLSIVLAILLWVRPPDIKINDVALGASPVSLSGSGLSIGFTVGISVDNPNWFSANFQQIKAIAKYPGSDSNFGGGELFDINFKGNSHTDFDFPFMLNYTTSLDPNQVILKDLVSKCGISGGSVQDITINYELTLKLKVVGITVSPKINNSASFKCPITADDISKISGSGGLDSLLGGSRRRSTSGRNQMDALD